MLLRLLPVLTRFVEEGLQPLGVEVGHLNPLALLVCIDEALERPSVRHHQLDGRAGHGTHIRQATDVGTLAVEGEPLLAQGGPHLQYALVLGLIFGAHEQFQGGCRDGIGRTPLQHLARQLVHGPQETDARHGELLLEPQFVELARQHLRNKLHIQVVFIQHSDQYILDPLRTAEGSADPLDQHPPAMVAVVEDDETGGFMLHVVHLKVALDLLHLVIREPDHPDTPVQVQMTDLEFQFPPVGILADRRANSLNIVKQTCQHLLAFFPLDKQVAVVKPQKVMCEPCHGIRVLYSSPKLTCLSGDCKFYLLFFSCYWALSSQ